jgi:hypothetical protein
MPEKRSLPQNRRRNSNNGHATKTANLLGLRPWTEVAAHWERISGQRLTRGRVAQIAKAAEQKIAAKLRGEQ